MLEIEDGSGLPDADAYADVDEADTLLSLLGVTQWATLTRPEKEAKLALGKMLVDDGSIYIYDGNRTTGTQNGEWPRIGATYGRSGPAVASDVIPPEIRRANIVAAGGLAQGIISGTGTPGASGLVKEKKIDTMSISYFSPKETGTSATSSGTAGPFADLGWPSITAIVAPLLDLEAYEEAAPDASDGGGVDSAISARRGPSWTQPEYGHIWHVGQDDVEGPKAPGAPHLSNQQI